MKRFGFTAALWVGVALFAGAFLMKGVPWLWPRLFPRPGEGIVAAQPVATVASPEVQVVAESVERVLASWGAELGAADAVVGLPRRRTPRELQETLRTVPELASTDVYVTAVGPVGLRLRVFAGKDLLLQRELQRWMPERPTVRAENPPELGIVFTYRPDDPAGLDRVLKWKSPLAVALPPFHPASQRAASKAIKAGKDIVVALEAEEDLGEQLAALPGVTGALVTERLAPEEETALHAALGARDLFVLDARADAAVRPPPEGVQRVVLAAHLRGPEDARLGRNLAVRWGYGLVTVDAAASVLSLAEDFIEIAKEDGYVVRLPAEVAREHAPRTEVNAQR